MIEAYGDAQRLGDGQPGRHRAVPAQGVAARPADRARGESGLSRRALSRQRRSGRLARCIATMKGKQAAADRPHRDLDHRGIESAAARVRERRARLPERARRPRSGTCSTPDNKLKPELAKRGIRVGTAHRSRRSSYTYFNMDDPVVGGYTPDKIALRRAIIMAYNADEDDPRLAPGPGARRDAADSAGRVGPRSEASTRGAATTRRAAQGAARQVRLRRPRRRRLARPARRQAADRCRWRRRRRAATASATSCGRRA